MRRRHQYHGYYGSRHYRRPRQYDYGPGHRRSTVPFRGAVIVLLALAALVVLASVT
jgi:hypothetical protein